MSTRGRVTSKEVLYTLANTETSEESSKGCSCQDVIRANSEGLMKKPKVSQPLGSAQNVSLIL